MMAIAIAAIFSMSGCKSQKTLTEATTEADPTEEVVEVETIQYVKPAANTSSDPVVAAPAQQASTVAPELKPASKDRTEQVTVVNKDDSGLLKSFNVIVGSFGSKTNAENQKTIMKNRGYKPFLIQNNQGMYRVVVAGFNTREEATAVRDHIRTTYRTEKGTCADAWLLIPQP